MLEAVAVIVDEAVEDSRDETQTFMIHVIIVIFIAVLGIGHLKINLFLFKTAKFQIIIAYMRVVGVPRVFENKLHFLEFDEPLDLDLCDVEVDGNDDVGALDWNFL